MRSELSEGLVLRRKAVIGTAGETSGAGGVSAIVPSQQANE